MEYLTVEQLYPSCEVLVMFRNGFCDSSAWGDFYIPVRIVKEFPRFFTCEVMPHNNKNGEYVTDKYTISINKFDIKARNVLVRPN